MKTINIVGENYCGSWRNARTACRAIIVKESEMLLSFDTKTGQWMFPGGGLEQNESEDQCVIREILEETGYVIKPSKCILEINEYY